MALFYECMLKCARKLLDTADIVREAMFHQQGWNNPANPYVEATAYTSQKGIPS
jgi:hypothetical protein